MTVFSVAMTDASSRKICVAAQPVGLHLVAARRPSISRAERARSAWMCGSSRRRPITSPPGGGTLARPRRASSGPASRNDARIRLGEPASASYVVISGRVDAQLVRARPLGARRRGRARSSSIVSTSRMRGTFASVTGSSVSRHAARIGSAPFLFPAARIAAAERVAALDHEGFAAASAGLTAVDGRRRAYA